MKNYKNFRNQFRNFFKLWNVKTNGTILEENFEKNIGKFNEKSRERFKKHGKILERFWKKFRNLQKEIRFRKFWKKAWVSLKNYNSEILKN